MFGPIKFTEAGNLAIHSLSFLASREPYERYPVDAIASKLDVSAHHLSKVLQKLASLKWVESTRGPTGGFRLVRSPAKISLLQALEAVEGKLGREKACLLGRRLCKPGHCKLQKIASHLRDMLAEQTIADLAADAKR